jgi:hypothetical protein
MANRRFIDFPIAATVGNNDIVLIWQDGLNKQTTKATLLQGSPQSLAGLTDVDIAALTNGQILQYNSTTSKWENVDRTDIFLSQLGDVTIVAPANGQVLVYNSSTSKWENSSGGYVPYTGAVTTVNLGAQSILAGSFVKAGGTAAQFLKANGSVDSTAYGTGTVTSVALTMPTAFSVANSPITTAGTLAVTGAGLVSQYIRGDGSLADFPATTGGGSSVSYYLNGSVSQGTIGGVAYRELNRTPIFGTGTDISINADGYIASFITDALDPNKLLIPAGNWNFETYFSASSNGGTPSFYVELYKYNGTTFTLIASSSSAPELIAFGTSLNPYFSTLAVPETVLALTDRLALRYYVTHSGRTITLHTENGHLCEVITTFTTGLTALNGLTNQVQFFAVGTSGTDFAISSVTDTHTFNLPTASATNRGALSSADWTTFNGKTSNLGTVTSVGLSSATSGVTIGSTPVTTSGTITLAIATASGSQNGLLSSTDWTTFNGKQNALTNPVTGTGTTNYLAKFTGTSTVGNSQIFDNGTIVGLGTGSTGGSRINILNIASNPALSIRSQNNIYEILTMTFEESTDLFSITNKQAFAQSGIAFGTNNIERARITQGGNLLVGTTTDAGYKLDVNGTGRFSGALTGSGINAVGTTLNNNNAYRFYRAGLVEMAYIGWSNENTNNSTWLFKSTNGNPIAFSADGTNQQLFINTSGSVGIGTTSPDTYSYGGVRKFLTFRATATNEEPFLQLIANGVGNSIIDFGNATIRRATIIGFDGSHLAFYTNGSNSGTGVSERMRITSGGNVGINTTNPTAKLSIIVPNSGSNQAGFDITNAVNASFNVSLRTDITEIIAGGTGNMAFTNSAERMRITAGGQIQIKQGANGFSDGLSIVNTLSNGWTFVNGGDNNLYFGYNGVGKGVFSNVTGVYTALSDANKKKDFEDSTIGLNAIIGLKPTLYRMKSESNTEKHLGFIAQEVKQYIPQAYVENGEFIGLNEMPIIAALVKSIQELNDKIK